MAATETNMITETTSDHNANETDKNDLTLFWLMESC